MIEYIHISDKEWDLLSNKEKKEKPYCIEYYNRSIYWKVNNKLHREDGPAIFCSNGTKHWYLNSFKYSFEEWLELTPISNEEKIFLKLKYL